MNDTDMDTSVDRSSEIISGRYAIPKSGRGTNDRGCMTDPQRADEFVSFPFRPSFTWFRWVDGSLSTMRLICEDFEGNG